MRSNLEIYRAANQLVKRYGEDAEFKAAERCDAMLEEGDPEGLAVWKRIVAAIDEMQRDKLGQGESIQ